MENIKENKSKRIFKIILSVLYYLIIVLLLGFSIITIASRDPKSVPNVFGRGFLAVSSNSMEGNNKDSFNEGDLIFVKLLNDETRKDLKAGDSDGSVVTFFDTDLGALNTHRVVNINSGIVITQGDNRAVSQYEDDAHNINDILALYTGKKIGKVGYALAFLNTKLGFGLIIVLPIFLLFVYQGVKVLLLVKEGKKPSELDIEAEKERLRAEILAELKEELKKENQDKE